MDNRHVGDAFSNTELDSILSTAFRQKVDPVRIEQYLVPVGIQDAIAELDALVVEWAALIRLHKRTHREGVKQELAAWRRMMDSDGPSDGVYSFYYDSIERLKALDGEQS